jgi:GntR family transcriptional repressor for pyruvate dehydrogenase complex
MERLGLVAQLEWELERSIALGMLPRDGLMPSEQTLAEKYRVSRATAREALVRLSVRGLVVQRPGRRVRAVALDEALTLENLGLALHGERSGKYPERRRMLEGFLALKREVTAELLVACCEQSSESDMKQLAQACFALADGVRWIHERYRWMELELELLREAALVAGRPGHYLLVQSLERAYRAVAVRVLPLLEAQAVSQWAESAMFALDKKNVQRLRTELPQLLRASDEHVLRGLAEVREAGGRHESHHTAELPRAAATEPEVGSSTPEPREVELRSNEPTSEGKQPAPGPAEARLCVGEPTTQERQSAHETVEAVLCVDSASTEEGQPAPEPAEAGLYVDEASAEVGQSAPGLAEVQGSGALCATWSDNQTRSRKAPPDRALPGPAVDSPCHSPGGVVLELEAAPLSEKHPGDSGAPCSQQPGTAPVFARLPAAGCRDD